MLLPVQDGDPSLQGLYVAYIDNDPWPFAERVLLFYGNDGWSYPMSDQRFRGFVHGWIGPLPVKRLND